MSTNTSTYKFNHTMIRVKDPKKSVAFYELLGMKLLRKLEMKEVKFDLYFLAYDSAKAASGGNAQSDREGIIELTHNYGSEDDDSVVYNNGNKDPHKGFGHTCISVDNIQAACKRLEDAGVKFQKRLTDGRMKSIAFALDPDDYWVEIIGQNPAEKTEDVKTTDIETYRMNHTMIRVKDPQKSIKFYTEILGMELLRTSENKEADFNLYFLGYTHGSPVPKASANGTNPVADREGILELTWNYGSEKEEGQVYHNGNDEPQGFGHTCMCLPICLLVHANETTGISVDNLEAACEGFEKKGVSFKKKLSDGKMNNIAFILDPDNYWIEVIQNEALKGKL